MILGTGVTIVDFAAVTLLQRAIPDDVLARVFSVLQSVFVGTIGLGALLAPALVSWLGIRGALLTSGAVLPLLTALLWRRLVRLDAAYLATDDTVRRCSRGADLCPARPGDAGASRPLARGPDSRARRGDHPSRRCRRPLLHHRRRRARGQRRRPACTHVDGRRRVRRDRVAPRCAANVNGRCDERSPSLLPRPQSFPRRSGRKPVEPSCRRRIGRHPARLLPGRPGQRLIPRPAHRLRCKEPRIG